MDSGVSGFGFFSSFECVLDVAEIRVDAVISGDVCSFPFFLVVSTTFVWRDRRSMFLGRRTI